MQHTNVAKVLFKQYNNVFNSKEPMSEFSEAMYIRLMSQLTFGPEISAYIHTDGAIALMIEAIANGRPPVTGISAELSSRFPQIHGSDKHRKFVGRAIKHALVPYGYTNDLDKARANLKKDPIFMTGSFYKPSMALSNVELDDFASPKSITIEVPFQLLRSVIATMPRGQLQRLQSIISQQLGA
jgi:hypothetical protein